MMMMLTTVETLDFGGLPHDHIGLVSNSSPDVTIFP